MVGAVQDVDVTSGFIDDSYPGHDLEERGKSLYKEILPSDLDIPFNPERHLALQDPGRFVSLAQLGYDDSISHRTVSHVAYSTPFRMLSDEGVEVLQRVLTLLEKYSRSSERIPSMVRGGVFRSQFIRGLATDPSISQFVSRHFNVSVVPHTIPHQLAHINYAPKELGRAVDLWHVDNVALDYVLFTTNTLDLEGGAFEVFRGTREEAALLHSQNLSLPPNRIDQWKAPAGYAILQQGHHVVHRAAPLLAPAKRVTFVNSFVPKDPNFPEASAPRILRAVDDENVVATEWALHRALRARAQLNSLIAQSDYSRPTEFYLERIKAIRDDLTAAYDLLLPENEGKEDHFGGHHDTKEKRVDASENQEREEL
eukprot:CAMPEP_0119119786 /NCGR_PEP_ID=MMETSP1310-20130426/1123_1 /TAXON_ID=464262 /ORGANISM="Genus nov. species nov., Strain RCC2339" /LENGTH=368 /DNA_ID=CAMNT_0007109235 /DNA_START=104 /DNA_END=1210 /DNA_ORIENTATION=+